MGTLAAIMLLCARLPAVTGEVPPEHPAHPDTLLREAYAFGEFENATRILVIPQGWVYVIDAARHEVALFRFPDREPVRVGGYGWGALSFDLPTGLDSDGLNLFVADYHNHRIQRFDRNLNPLSSFSTRDTSFLPARFGYPTGVVLSRLGEMFVLDSENLRVLKFSPQGRFQLKFGERERSGGTIRKPLKTAISARDRVYVLEPDRVLEFDYFGTFLRALGDGVLNDARGFAVSESELLVVESDTLRWISLPSGVVRSLPASHLFIGNPPSPFQDVAVTERHVYVLTTHRVVVFERVGSSRR
jgi:DNA-binding beta-propeller fold protein YncE